MKTTALALSTAALLTAGSAGAILVEDFEDNTVAYTLSNGDGAISEFTDGGGDFFLRTDGSDIGGFVEYTGQNGSSFFAGMDLDGEGTQEPFFQNFNGINISGLTNLELSILLAEDDDDVNEDWDASDFVHIDYQIDNGGYFPLLYIEAQQGADAFNDAPAVDTNLDGFGDGAVVTNIFTEFLAPIAGTGSTLDLRITWDLDSSDEDLAIDDVSVNGVIPEPTSLALLGLGGLLVARRRKG